ncbi:hypothetical protein ACFV6Z_28110 [Streptomyces sp. NPDC059818]|uniref:hypothetical protein n=1 Tax=Streptomyces sp. NPDC059818 TaxID=3346962 RepID=UPI0036497DC8
MPTSEHEVRQPPRAVSMRDLLAAGAAAIAVSTPPGAVRPGAAAPPEGAPSAPDRA